MDAGSINQLAFDLKQTLTDYRATAGTSAVIALSVDPKLVQPLLDRGIGAYTDVILQFVPAGDLASALERVRHRPPAVAVAAPADPEAAQAFLRDAATLAKLLPPGLAPTTGGAPSCGGSVGELFLRPGTQELVAVVSCRPGDDVRHAAPQQIIERADFAGGLSVVRLAAPASERFAEDVQVRGGRQLTVEEIIARHQAVVRRQSSRVDEVISEGTMTLTFEAPGMPAPMTISARTIIYRDGGRTDLEQREIRVNGIQFQGGRVPRLPILEPERVAAVPLTISLTDDYRYHLEPDESVDGERCYVVRFDPLRGGPLFRGRAWISMERFGLVKVAAVQTGLRGPIVSSEQVDRFVEAEPGVWLLSDSDVRQIYEGPGHRTPIHRRVTLGPHFVNPDDFDLRRSRAYTSDSVMLRDTPEGYRYLRKPQTTERVPVIQVAKAATRVRTLAGGVIIDPNISIPLPFAGISYVDFDLFGSGAQFSGFFGGAYGQVAFSVPSVLKSRWQLAGRAFAIASSYNDRSFRNGREIYDESLRQRPAHASIWVLRPLTARVSIRAGYDLDYTHLRAAPETAASFVVPADQIVHAGRFALEGQRSGWAASIWWTPARRTGWRAWGHGSEYDTRHAAFQRFGATVSKSSVLTPRLVSRVEAHWMDGSDLDRFSRYSFGTFDNRLRGYPSSLVRYDRGGVARAALAWSAAKFVRVDGFVDTASVRDRGYGAGLRNYTGVGAAAEGPAPFGLLAAVEWGYGFRGVRSDGGRGTQVVRVSVFKVF
jgi:hypothetical protein